MENSSSAFTETSIQSAARNLKLSDHQVRVVAELLAEGNTVPFITRYRVDATGGLDEKQISAIRQELTRLAALDERRAVVLKSIENQGKLDDELKANIERASSARQLEEIYLPYKPRKQSLATTARQQGLEPLAIDILEARTSEVDLPTRAADFVRVDKGIETVDEVFRGVRHLLAERFSEHIKLRSAVRKLFRNQGKIQTALIEDTSPAADKEAAVSTQAKALPKDEGTDSASTTETTPATEVPTTAATPSPAEATSNASNPGSGTHMDEAPEKTESNLSPSDVDSTDNEASGTEAPVGPTAGVETADADMPGNETPVSETPVGEAVGGEAAVGPSPSPAASSAASSASAETESGTAAAAALLPAAAPAKKKKKKKKKKKRKPDAYAEFAKFSQELSKLPPHRVLAINRGERAGRIKVSLVCDEEALRALALETLVPAEHPFRDFLVEAADDALHRLVVPAVERELRRELTEQAESHAVRVFARNLRGLLLQKPVRRHRIMGIDPGYRSGCKVAVIDANGDAIGTGVFSIVGNDERRQNNLQRLRELLDRFQPSLIAIGNGSGCHTVEQFVADTIATIDDGREIRYTIVNQAGSSVYSTSEIAREELPELDALRRSAVSIARRLQDPLSELVKIPAYNIGVGMYQHDVRARHLVDALEEEVESCVNLVGVDVNTASAALLQHVAGVGPLIARRIVEYRAEQGPFPDLQALRNVPGMGEVTWKQSVGFLRVPGSDVALDRTLLHPESYEAASRIVSELQGNLSDLFLPETEAEEITSGQPSQDTVSSSASTQASESNAGEPSPAESSQHADQSAETGAVDANVSPADSGPGDAAPMEPAPESEEQAAAATEPSPGSSESPDTSTPTPATPEKQKNVLTTEELEALRQRRSALVQKIRELDIAATAQRLGIGEMAVRDIVRALRNPGYDPRDNQPTPLFRSSVLKLETLQPGQQLRGQVVNVVDFGVFVNVGSGDSCLIHISRLSNRFIRDPHLQFCVGDVLDVWVVETDKAKRRVTLTAIRPGSDKSESGRGARGGRRRSDGPSGRSRQEGNKDDGRPPRRREWKKGEGSRRGAHGGRSGGRSFERKPHKPKPVKPITEEMAKGEKPMRSFSDLLQFHQMKSNDKKSNNKK